MSDSSGSEGSDNKWMPLQKDGESDQQVAAETDVSLGKVESENLEQEPTAGGDSDNTGGDGSEQKEDSYPLPSEQAQMERDKQGDGESNE